MFGLELDVKLVIGKSLPMNMMHAILLGVTDCLLRNDCVENACMDLIVVESYQILKSPGQCYACPWLLKIKLTAYKTIKKLLKLLKIWLNIKKTF